MAVNFFQNAFNTDARYAIFNDVQGDQHNIPAPKPSGVVPADNPNAKILGHLEDTGNSNTKIVGYLENTDYFATILVVGASGTGKSKFINRLTGTSELPIGDGSQSCTRDLQSTEYLNQSDCKIRLIDTPGFDHTAKSDLDVLKEIAHYVSTMSLTGVVYMHRANDFMGRSARHQFRVFQKLCGDDGLSNVTIVTTMWDTISPELHNEREAALEFFFKPVLDKGGQVVCHCDTSDSAKSIISSLIDRKLAQPLQIQRELFDNTMDIYQTEAGMELTQEFRKQLPGGDLAT
jgi:GTPase Era involved in 16S rRNA processing